MITLTFATFLLVFLRAWQQQNVIHGYYWWSAITAYGMIASDVAVVLGVVNFGYAAIPYAGTGGAVGVVSSMWLHKRIRK